MKTAVQELIEIMMEEWGEGRGLPEWAENMLEKEKEQINNLSNYKEQLDRIEKLLIKEEAAKRNRFKIGPL